MNRTARPPRPENHLLHVALGACAVLVGLLAIALVLLSTSMQTYQGLGIKILEVLAQVTAVTVAGGMLLQVYLKWHSRELAINDFRRAVLDGLIQDYIEVKRIRRMLRACAEHGQGGTQVNPWTHLPAAAYDKYLTELNGCELSLEVLCRRVEVFASVFPDAQSLAEGVKAMHNYLDAIISEFERHKSIKRPESDLLPVSELEALSGFMLRKERSSFTAFALSYRGALQVLQGSALRVSI